MSILERAEKMFTLDSSSAGNNRSPRPLQSLEVPHHRAPPRSAQTAGATYVFQALTFTRAKKETRKPKFVWWIRDGSFIVRSRSSLRAHRYPWDASLRDQGPECLLDVSSLQDSNSGTLFAWNLGEGTWVKYEDNLRNSKGSFSYGRHAQALGWPERAEGWQGSKCIEW